MGNLVPLAVSSHSSCAPSTSLRAGFFSFFPAQFGSIRLIWVWLLAGIVQNKTPATKVEKAESEPRFGVNIGDYSARLRLLSGASNKANLRGRDCFVGLWSPCHDRHGQG
jgi:hypothetical protein